MLAERARDTRDFFHRINYNGDEGTVSCRGVAVGILQACYNRRMLPVTREPDELLEQVLEDERASALQEWREREIVSDMSEPGDA